MKNSRSKEKHVLRAPEPCQEQTRLIHWTEPNKTHCVELRDIIIMHFKTVQENVIYSISKLCKKMLFTASIPFMIFFFFF